MLFWSFRGIRALRPTIVRYLCWLTAALLGASSMAHAQAGPPFNTNDPGTPGNGNWEINIASAQTISRGNAAYQVPQLDINYGLGERVQLTYEIPYVVANSDGQNRRSGWSNAFPGIKWRFLDQGEGGWQMSVFPQYEMSPLASAVQKGIAVPGSRLFLPVEVTKRFGPIELDFEAGYYPPKQGERERISGLLADRAVSNRLELGAEIFNDRSMGVTAGSETTLGLGGRYEISRGFVALFMAGHSIAGTSGAPQFIGYFGVQILLSDYGRSLAGK